MPAIKPIPDSYPRVSPHLSVVGAADAIDFYKSVLGATERMRMACPTARWPTPSWSSMAR
jgi:PhnB protein